MIDLFAGGCPSGGGGGGLGGLPALEEGATVRGPGDLFPLSLLQPEEYTPGTGVSALV